jgi:hypothetical protein
MWLSLNAYNYSYLSAWDKSNQTYLRTIYILSDSQAEIKAHGKHQITSELVWDC